MSPSTSTRTSGTRRPSRTVLGALAAGAATVLLAGCGAGQVGTIGSQVAAVNGSEGTVGDLDVRDVSVAFPTSCASGYTTGQDAPLLFTIANSGVSSDELTSITSPAGVVVLDGSTTVSGSRTLVSALQESIDTSAGATTQPGVVSAELTGLTQDLRPGLTFPVTFIFSKAGPVTLPVPIGSPSTECAETDG